MNFSHMVRVGTILLVLLGMVPCSYAQDELVELVTGLLAEEDKDVRALALDQIRLEAKGEAMTRRFAELLPRFPAATQVGLLRALADRGDRAAAPAVRSLLKAGPEESVRVAAVEALGSVGDQEDLKLLVQTMSADSEPMRKAAESSLVRLPSEASAAIVAEMQQVPPPMRVSLIQILTIRHAREAIPALLEWVRGDDATVRSAAMSALAELADTEHIGELLPLVMKAKNGRERDAAEKAIATVCQRNPDQQGSAAPLLAALKKAPVLDQPSLLPTLGRVGGDAALAVVDEAFKSSQADMHKAALRALCNWPDGAVVSRLLRAARTDESAGQRKLALQALIRIAPLADDRADGLRLDTLRTVFVMCASDAERNRLLDRAKAIRNIDTLRFLTPFLDQPAFAQQACLTLVELAHHSSLREANREEFHRLLDRVIQISKDSTVKDRAHRYKAGQTWVRPKA